MNIMKVNLHIRWNLFIISIPLLEKEDDGSYEKDYDVDVEPKYSRMRPGIDEEPDDKIPRNDENFKKEKKFQSNI